MATLFILSCMIIGAMIGTKIAKTRQMTVTSEAISLYAASLSIRFAL